MPLWSIFSYITFKKPLYGLHLFHKKGCKYERYCEGYKHSQKGPKGYVFKHIEDKEVISKVKG
jgi:hypothetical protein